LEVAWETAANCLKGADKLTVVGYSFPAYDRKARELFLRNFIVPNLGSDSRPRLAVVNPDEGSRNTIKSWFLPAVDGNIDEYSSFEEYCNGLA
ncbi:MAG TPA: hypothetical protein VJM80_11155, partial [bacterium]|nr:hypothetical protein [bacterium]